MILSGVLHALVVSISALAFGGLVRLLSAEPLWTQLTISGAIIAGWYVAAQRYKARWGAPVLFASQGKGAVTRLLRYSSGAAFVWGAFVLSLNHEILEVPLIALLLGIPLLYGCALIQVAAFILVLGCFGPAVESSA